MNVRKFLQASEPHTLELMDDPEKGLIHDAKQLILLAAERGWEVTLTGVDVVSVEFPLDLLYDYYPVNP